MGHIFYITGPSSSGKDTIFKSLLEQEDLHLKNIVMYTTRPIREGEVEGIEYNFVTEKELKRLRRTGRVIEERSYNTFHGIWTYFTVSDEQIELDKNDYLMIGTVESFIKTKGYFGIKKVVPIFIEVDDGIRLQRALDREKAQEKPKYQELCRRYLADASDFSEENIQKADIRRRFHNETLENCIEEVVDYIKKIQEDINLF